eukprot:TRINITY_DN9761_c0_g1_i1.p1 TRINITY_DN9761_c0_g1~~TRINITY_DN9761_c0_g1_i1.p1  ORF type:complete len:450 (+),score=116.69 TRINITY_DN9761_c0_g1_i1:135-1352(+)
MNGSFDKSIYEEQQREFQLEQNKKRAVIRINEARATFIDLLIYLTLEKEDVSKSDITLFDHFSEIYCNPTLLNELMKEIQFFMDVPQNKTYWRLLFVICEEYLKEISNPDLEVVQSTIYQQVVDSVKDIGYTELLEVENGIKLNIDSGNSNDEEYWCTLLEKLRIFKAKAKLNEVQKIMIEKKISKLSPEAKEYWSGLIESHKNTYEFAVLPESEKIYVEKQEENEIEAEPIVPLRTAEEMLTEERNRAMEEDEEPFNVDYELPDFTEEQLTELGYVPKKPKFYNTVRKIIFWNGYNKKENTNEVPPKQVQGYKFSIFLPEKHNITEAPSFVLDPCEDENHQILRFICGAPYKDVAFKIAKGEWQQTKKFGYRCHYDNAGLLQLWFNFKLSRWRRAMMAKNNSKE